MQRAHCAPPALAPLFLIKARDLNAAAALVFDLLFIVLIKIIF
jgi:hypothetical protein